MYIHTHLHMYKYYIYTYLKKKKKKKVNSQCKHTFTLLSSLLLKFLLQVLEQWMLERLSSCDPGVRVQVQQAVQQVVGLTRDSVKALSVVLSL